ncbi:MAG: SH3 domain-containing protein [Verrucomicrobiaceae bacterium]
MKTPSAIPAFFLSSVLIILSGFESAWSQPSDRTSTYSITGIAINDVLNVRSGPGMNFPIVAKLSDGDGGVRITGESVVNGEDDWVPIQFPGGKGWTRPKFLTLSPSRIEAQEASGIPAGFEIPESSRSPNGKYGVLVPSELKDDKWPASDQNKLVEIATGRVLAVIRGQTGVANVGNHALVPKWSADSSLLLWEVAGDWEPVALALLKIDRGTVKWQVNIKKEAQQAAIAAAFAADHTTAEKASEWNLSHRPRFPNTHGFQIWVEAGGKDAEGRQKPPVLPLSVHAALETRPPRTADFPDDLSMAIEVDGQITRDGEFVEITFKPLAGDESKVYRVTGIDSDDVLNVRSGPGANYSIVAKFLNGKRGFRITGQSVNNGADDWVPIEWETIENEDGKGKGWTRPMYLAEESDSWKPNDNRPLATKPPPVKEPASEAGSPVSSLRFRFDGEFIPSWSSTVPKSMGTYKGRTITITIAKAAGASNERPPAKDLALLDTILLRLPQVLAAAEKAITHFNKEAESNYIERPNIYIGDPGPHETWVFTVYEKDADDTEGLSLMFSGTEFVEIADPPF